MAPRKTVSIFEGEDYELKQLLSRSYLVPTDSAASALRMFFCLEVGQLLLSRQCDQVADNCGLEGAATMPWLKTKILFTAEGFSELLRGIDELTTSYEALSLEYDVRKQAGDSSASAQLFTQLLTDPITKSLGIYRECIECIDGAIRRSGSNYRSVGRRFVEFFSEVGVMPQDYLSIVSFMHQISSTETLSPWTTTLPFL